MKEGEPNRKENKKFIPHTSSNIGKERVMEG